MKTFIEYFAQLFNGNTLAIIGAALAVILPGIGSARGVNLVARATAGLISEDPNKYGKSMLLQALPMTQGIYGMVTAFLIMIFGGVMTTELTLATGAYYLFAAMPIAFGGLYSAIRQGEVAAAGISVLAKRPDAVGKAVISASFVELYAILGLLISLLLILMKTVTLA
ncbi:MAG: V-type ATP synthase subunit K [Ruminococcaceae bacterium]|nr:V-type ATP synthase subunit K [Oscillospiraceae bacterium]